MIIGQMLTADSIGSISTYFSDWFPRQANRALFACEMLAKSGGANLTITVQTKNTEDTDTDATTLGTFDAINTTGTFTADASGAKELVRYKYELLLDWIHFRMLPPSWVSN